jgi:hypothetical protein
VTSLPAAQQQALAAATRDEFERYDIVQRAIVEKLVVDCLDDMEELLLVIASLSSSASWRVSAGGG